MTRVHYSGITNPKAAFEPFREVRANLIRMMTQCRPFHADYLVLMAAKEALETCAYHFTREPNYFSTLPAASPWKPGDPGGDARG